MTKIIAEAGVNHNGKLNLAKKLIDIASSSGADFVKFQVFVTEENISKFAPKAKYQIINTGKKETQFEMVKKLELTFQEHLELFNYSKKKKINYLATPFDVKSLHFLLDLKLNLIKIPSGEITNEPFLSEISKSNCKLILSTGMSSLNEISKAIKTLTLKKIKKNDICLLHCNTEYPTPYKDVNLNAMKTIGRYFNMEVGYSDHTKGTIVPIMAATLGAKYLEKHFTLNNSMKGPDHTSSLSPRELKEVVFNNQLVKQILGSSYKRASESEIKNKLIARKSLVAGSTIKKGEIFTLTNLKIKRPGNGLSPSKFYKLLGTRSKKNYNTDDQI
jgi:N,N'-diacetyllegionaminate synthase